MIEAVIHEEIEFDTFKSILEFLYTGQTTSDNINSVLEVANKLKLTDLQKNVQGIATFILSNVILQDNQIFSTFQIETLTKNLGKIYKTGIFTDGFISLLFLH